MVSATHNINPDVSSFEAGNDNIICSNNVPFINQRKSTRGE